MISQFPVSRFYPLVSRSTLPLLSRFHPPPFNGFRKCFSAVEKLLCKFLSTHSVSVGIYSIYKISILGHTLINYVTYIIVLGVVEC